MSSKVDYEQYFHEADTDRNGTLDLDELSAYLRKKGYRGTDQDIKKIFNAVDTSGDHKISLEEYLFAMGQLPPRQHDCAVMRRVFLDFDLNGDGQIDRHELKEVFEEMGKYFSDEEIARMIEIADKDDSGTLDYEEFIEYVFGIDA